MDPSQTGAPAKWHGDVTADDWFDALHKAAMAGVIVPTPPSLGLEHHQHLLPRHVWPNDSHQLDDGTRPPTPPRQDEHDGSSDSRLWYAPNQQVRSSQAAPVHNRLLTSPDGHLYEQHYSANYHGDSAQRIEALPRLHPFANLLHSSPEPRSTQLAHAQPSPPIQQWPTHNLVDTKIRKKEEEYRKKGQAKRAGQRQSEHWDNSTLVLHHRVAPKQAPTPTRKLGKRKAGFINTLVPSSPPPSLRHSALGHGYGTRDPPGFPYLSPYAYIPNVHTPGYSSFPPQPLFGPRPWPSHGKRYPVDALGQQRAYNNVNPVYGRSSRRPKPQMEVAPPPEPANREALYQAITDNYDEYKWPVKCYELHADSAFDSAHAYMEAWFKQNVFSSEARIWHAHTTSGFIKEGNRFSMLVLHNAANPFKNTPLRESTTSIGVYGRYAHTHEEIHWTTISPNVQDFLIRCPDLTFKHTWHVDMTKASEKRFHRAYWLAAKMLPLKGLLNHGLVPEKPHDAPEDEDANADFDVGEDDLQCAWNGGQPSAEECGEAWQRILDEIGTKKVHELGSEHITIGGTEMMS